MSSMGPRQNQSCVLIHRQVWQLRLTLHFLSDSGNLLDCASIASMTALRHFRKPEVEVLGDEVIIVCLPDTCSILPSSRISAKRVG